MSFPAEFHPAVAAWFEGCFAEPTPAQAEGWPLIRDGRHVLIAAPTGSGKTLAAFLSAIDSLFTQGECLADETQVVYVSPLRALSNDVQKNLQAPLAGIRSRDGALPELRVLVRTGDTPGTERAAMTRRPPHILVTTPESLYLMLSSAGGRRLLATTRTVIVDEIHALVRDKRGSHLALSLERLEALAGRPIQRIGLSATQKPLEDVGAFLVGQGRTRCELVDAGSFRRLDLSVEIPPSPLASVCSHEQWAEIHERLAALIQEHRTTLVFVNTRKMAERIAAQLSKLLGEEAVTSHHGSLARERRLEAEQRLKSGSLRALVATASLELGIDVGEVDLVLQVGATRSIATLLQRVGRSGHGLGRVPKGRLFPLTVDELAEAAALLLCVRGSLLDRTAPPPRPLDILAQQIVAECVEQNVGRAAPVRDAAPRVALPRRSTRAEFDEVVRLHSESGRRALLHRDSVGNGRLRATRRARLTRADVRRSDPGHGRLPGPSRARGNAGRHGERGLGDRDERRRHLPARQRLLARAARGARDRARRRRQGPAAEHAVLAGRGAGAHARAVGRDRRAARGLRRRGTRLGRRRRGRRGCLRSECGDALPAAAAVQIAEHVIAGERALGAVPTQRRVVLERFFDESGGMQLVVHAPFGSRINRAWGLALRKRFCVGFGFELQAAANEEAIVLSLGPQHSFPLDEVFDYLHPATARDVLVQALLAAPMFGTRWRWNAQRSLLLERARNGRRLPAALVRMRAEDLLAAAFPQALACPETLPGGPIEVPDDHPIVRQTVEDCLTEAMDVEGFLEVLAALRDGTIERRAVDTPEPSAFARGILSSQPYTFLDDAPLEERRTRAVMTRRVLDPRAADEIGALDPDAIARVRDEAWPHPSDPDEVHEALLWMGYLTVEEARDVAGVARVARGRAAAWSACRTAGSRSKPRASRRPCCAGGSRRSGRSSSSPARRTRRCSSSSRPRASCSACASPVVRRGAIGACSRVSTATRSIACAARSSR